MVSPPSSVIVEGLIASEHSEASGHSVIPLVNSVLSERSEYSEASDISEASGLAEALKDEGYWGVKQ